MNELTAARAEPKEFWSALTSLPAKLALYQQEAFLGPAIAAARSALGEDFPARLQRLAVLVVQPDLIAQRRVEQSLEFARFNAFEPAFAAPFVMHPKMTAELWRYSNDTSTVESLEVCDLFCAKSESLLVVFADQTPALTVPASLRLAKLKGPISADSRSHEHLRSFLGATNSIITAVHCSDEPLDILRELAILFPDTLEELFAQLAVALDRGTPAAVTEHIEAIYTRVPTHDINVPNALLRLRALSPGAGGHLAAERLQSNLDRWERQESPLDWRAFSTDLRAIGIAPDSWDALLVATQYMDHERPGTRLIQDNGYVGWLAGDGNLLR